MKNILKLVEAMVVVANFHNPNQKYHIVALNIFETKDYRVDIKLALKRFKI